MSQLALRDRLAELPYRFRRPESVQEYTWALTDEQLSRVRITWPTEYQWPPSAVIVETHREGLVRLGVLDLARTPQVHKGVISLQCQVDGSELRVALDYSDYHEMISEGALAESDLYFKCQYKEGGYGDKKIVPGGYMTSHLRYYRYHGPYRRRYNSKPTIDVVARFGFAFQREIRQRALDLLAQEAAIRSVGNTGKVRYSRFLKEVAASRLSLHLPGNGPFTYRVAEFLGLGTCMISMKFATMLHVPLVPGVHYAQFSDDLSNMVDQVRYYLSNDTERQRIADAGRDYFDRYLHFDQLSRYHVTTILNHHDR
jgi:hypothetical protein